MGPTEAGEGRPVRGAFRGRRRGGVGGRFLVHETGRVVVLELVNARKRMCHGTVGREPMPGRGQAKGEVQAAEAPAQVDPRLSGELGQRPRGAWPAAAAVPVGSRGIHHRVV